MTKKIGVAVINFYQVLLSPILKTILGAQRFCRFDETCSDYTKRKISEKGLISGIIAGGIRISRCQPFSRLEGTK
jgi:putative component of membrane protein insertase Oxa1/YidC/SpoIIIJ protein YidD